MGLAVVFLGLLGWRMATLEPYTGYSGAARVNKPALDFTLPLFDGGEFVLSEHRGEPVIINFWASWCPPCREEAPGLERTWRAYREQGVTFVGVDIFDLEEDARAYIREFDITYPNGPDATGSITVDYGVSGIPVTFFVGKYGVVRRRFVGAISESTLVEWTQELVAGVAPSGAAEGENLEDFFELDR